MTNTDSLGYFLDFYYWENALNLLNFQIEQKKTNRHFNTLAMCCYERLGSSIDALKDKEYFDERIASNLFYGLTDEFKTVWYSAPKHPLMLRRWAYLSYPMRAAYYSVGLYLLKLSQDFLQEQKADRGHIRSYYGGDINFQGNNLLVNSSNVYYKQYYESFTTDLKTNIIQESADKLVIKIDIANYFNEFPIDLLLSLLEKNIKPCLKEKLKYDAVTINQLSFFFKFIAQKRVGIPQVDNEIISGFIGELYLHFADIYISELINQDRKIVKSHSVLRYVDDIYISIVFNSNVEEVSRANYASSLASRISDDLHYKFELLLNTKTKFYWLNDPESIQELMKNIKKVSSGCMASKDDGFLPIMIDSIFCQLEKLKELAPKCIFDQNIDWDEDIMKEVLSKPVEQMLNRTEYKNRLNIIFTDFNYEFVKLHPLVLIILIIKNQQSRDNFKAFLLSKSNLATNDIHLIIRFLCQTNFSDADLMDKLRLAPQLKEVVEAYQNPELYSDKPGYFDLDWNRCKPLISSSGVIDQIRLRRTAEISGSFSVALNHLLNEIHAICWEIENDSKKSFSEYTQKDVNEFLISRNVPGDICTDIRNLFDKRNTNRVSHPSFEPGSAWNVTKDEYEKYSEAVKKALAYIL